MVKNGALCIAFVVLFSTFAAGQDMKMPGKKAMTDQQKIAQAESAGPAVISKQAGIVDMATMKELRKGTNGWVCYAFDLGPMCLDKSWQAWADAYMHKTEPKITTSGVAYMLAGDSGASNTDPFAMTGTKDNKWVLTGPHVMLLFPDKAMLDAYPDDPNSGGPWVMWRGSPYAHVMVPVTVKNQVSMPVMK